MCILYFCFHCIGPYPHMSRDSVSPIIVILDGPKLRPTTVQMAGPKLRLTCGPLHYRSNGRSKIHLTGGPLEHRPNGRSKFTSNRWSIGSLSKWTVQNYVSQVIHWTIVQMDSPKLRLTGGPLDHCPFVQLSFVNLDGPNYAIFTKELSSHCSL